MESSIYQRASQLHALYVELRALLAAEHGNEWLKHIDPIIGALAPPFESEEQCAATITEAHRRFNALFASKGVFAEFYIHRDDPGLRAKANVRFEQLKKLLYVG